MVYIKKIDMRGFKTFGRKVTLTLDKGLSVITGPNGVGKSNILDSVKFALGELSAKELRGASLGDLIYKSSPDTAARSAYVAVQFDNKDRRISVDSDVVTISREFQRGGEGIYRLNGRRVSRKQLGDTLSSADILLTGHNLVPQHAITRLAEVTPEERRDVIGDLIGIGVYDLKKEEAKVQLNQAELNLKVASARIDEVRLRVEALEKERNDYLRFTALRNETNNVQARLTSHELLQLQAKMESSKQTLETKQNEINELKQKLDESQARKDHLQEERRRFEDHAMEQGGKLLFEVERSISDVNAQIAGLETRVEAGEANAKAMEKQRAELNERIQRLSQSIDEYRLELKKVRGQKERISHKLRQQEGERSLLHERATQLRDQLSERNRKAETVEGQIVELTKQLIKSNAEIKGSSTKLGLLENLIKNQEQREAEYGSLIEQIRNHVEELRKQKTDEETRLRETEQKIAEYVNLADLRDKEVLEALEVAKKARLSLVEFETQKNIAEEVSADENALTKIEEMGRDGAIPGVIGRLGALIKVSPDASKAADAAASGWTKALIVKDLMIAATCVEHLKRMKLGRIKIIPIESVSNVKPIEELPDTPGVKGRMVDFIKTEKSLRPALNFVFGDTVLTDSQKAAFLCCLQGYRAVVTTGDLYEAGGAIESGYYREPLDIEALMHSASKIENLSKTVASLEGLANRGLTETERLSKDVEFLSEAAGKSRNAITAIDKEMELIQGNLQRWEKAISEIGQRLGELAKDLENEKEFHASTSLRKSEVQNRLTEILREKASLKLKSKSAALIELENRLAEADNQINELRKQELESDGKIAALSSSIETSQGNLAQDTAHLRSLNELIENGLRNVESAKVELSKAKERLKQLEDERRGLAEAQVSLKDKRAEFDVEIKKLENETRVLFNKHEPLNKALNELNTSLAQDDMRRNFLAGELKNLGHESPIEPGDVEELKDTLMKLKRESDAIGAVNALAVEQYEEVQGNYTQLSSRITDLEKEKLSILEFMNELDRKKFETFMQAFNQVNASFQKIFGNITGGGTGKLLLEHLEDPFKGGVDVNLQFPGKAEMTIGSASGGEKSVATVTFLLALQTIHPMPFYFFDEIDAHLDALNTRRLADLLKERARGSQFIVNSLKDTTISRADRVYGVFIQDGVSQVVGLPMVKAS